MPERGFNETDLRLMLEDARHVRHDVEPGRWAVETAFSGRPWRVILEPDLFKRRSVLITAFELHLEAP
jgi:hypothetical protein